MTRDKEASSLLQPPVPLTRAATTNWPLLMSMEQIFDNKWAGVEEAAAVAVDEEAQQTTFLPGFDDDEEEGGTAPNAGGGFDGSRVFDIDFELPISAWGDDALASTEEEVDIGNAWGSDEDLGSQCWSLYRVTSICNEQALVISICQLVLKCRLLTIVW